MKASTFTLPFLYSCGRGSILLSLMHECPHTLMYHTHPFMYSAEFAYSALEMWMQTGFKSSSLSFLPQRTLLLNISINLTDSTTFQLYDLQMCFTCGGISHLKVHI